MVSADLALGGARDLPSDVQRAQARALKAGAPFVELFNYPIDRSAISLLTPLICRRHEVLPLGLENGHLILAMVDPGNVVAMDDVRAAVHSRWRW